MKRPVLVALAVAAAMVVAAALVVAGCGGGSGSTGPQTLTEHTEEIQGGNGEGTPKKATAPNAPAGSKVVACTEGRMETVQLRATAVDCNTARTTMQRWESSHACTLGHGSRSSCSLGSFRCQATKVDRGAAVSCAQSGGDISFITKSWLLKKAGAG